MAQSEKVFRSPADGELTIISVGDSDVNIQSGTVKKLSGYSLAKIPKGNGAVELTWQQKPKRLLVISDKSWKNHASNNVQALQRGEKQPFRLLKRGRVPELVRLSHGPDFDGWNRKEFSASGPMGDQMNFAVDEIGPHNSSGDYQRTWIVRYTDGTEIRQRQVNFSYSVGNQKKQVESDRFFRRDKLEGEGGNN